MKSIYALGFFFGFYLLSCTTDHSLGPDAIESPVKTALVVSVFDQDGIPVSEALVAVEQYTGYTDAFGLFYVPEMTASKRAYLTVHKAGYFQGSRQFYPEKNSTSYLRISLIRKVSVGTISNNSGGMVQVDQETSSLHFPAGAVSYANGTAYNGLVEVKAFTIQADDPDMSTLMPGRLEAVNDQGELGVLLSYGMMAVELQSPGGEELIVTPGHKVEMRLQVPGSMVSTAPPIIPMWYFDEEDGEWIQEGDAVLDGDTYVAQLSHFSFWNCDDWASSIEWEATFVEESAEALKNLQVCLTVLSTNASICDYTNSNGQVLSNIPTGELFLVEVINECGQAIFSEQLGPYNKNTKYGPVTILNNQGGLLMTSVSGTVIGCDNQPVTNGYALIQVGKANYVSKLNPLDGTFVQQFFTCPEAEATIVAIDANTAKQSLPRSLPFEAVVDAGTLKACDVLDEYILIQVNGYSQSYFFVPQIDFSTFDSTMIIRGLNPYPPDAYFELYFNCNTPGPCALEEGSGGGFDLPTPESGVRILNMNLVLEEFGPVGGKIRGTFNGILNGGDNGQGGPEYSNFSGSFSVTR